MARAKTVPDHPPSPCINVCRLDPDMRHCVGCYRTVDEIANWTSYSAAEKAAVLENLQVRHRFGNR